MSLSLTKITSLPDNLKVKNYLDLLFSNLSSIPKGLKVDGDLFLANTPLSQKYTPEEIKKMIEDKEGYVTNRIFAANIP